MQGLMKPSPFLVDGPDGGALRRPLSTQGILLLRPYLRYGSRRDGSAEGPGRRRHSEHRAFQVEEIVVSPHQWPPSVSGGLSRGGYDAGSAILCTVCIWWEEDMRSRNKRRGTSSGADGGMILDVSRALEAGQRLDALEEALLVELRTRSDERYGVAVAILVLGFVLALLMCVGLVLLTAAFFHWVVGVVLGVLLAALLLILLFFMVAMTRPPLRLDIDNQEEESDDQDPSDEIHGSG